MPAGAGSALAQAPQGGPKLTLVLRSDMKGQDQRVQETVVNILEMPPGSAAPWHMHPGAQEILFVIDGNVTVEIEGQGTTALKGRRGRSHSCRDSPPCPKRWERRRESVGDPQPRRQGQTLRPGGEAGNAIAPGGARATAPPCSRTWTTIEPISLSILRNGSACLRHTTKLLQAQQHGDVRSSFHEMDLIPAEPL